MTAIVPLSIKTKKALKERLLAREPVRLSDPTPWGDRAVHLNYTLPDGELVHLWDNRRMEPGAFLTCTNHPKRSWFAQITVKPDGSLKVT